MRLQPKPLKKYPWYIRFFFYLQRKKYQKELLPSKIWARSPKLFSGFNAFFAAVDRKSSPLPPELRSLVSLYVSEINRCAFCSDINAFRSLKRGISENKIKALHQFQSSPLFSEKEKVALEYAEAVTITDRIVSEALFTKLKQHFSEEEILELTALIVFQDSSSKFNRALDIPSQGFLHIVTVKD